ncbi:MAG TPA: YihY/virulence factor BrkB family protein [Terriglobales bacterium]|nr:YihY/virulence factor BrkB family protein [Terriglobales bacterium]
MKLVALKNAIVETAKDIQCNHTFAMAAGLSYYFLLSLFPLLIFIAGILAYIPIPGLFEEILNTMSRFVPGPAMGTVREILSSVLTPPATGWISFGLIFTIWTASSGFAALIEGLNVAYDVPETRPYWRVRLLALGLAVAVGSCVIVGLAVSLLGPRFGQILEEHRHAGPLFAAVWPTIHWVVIVASIVIAVEVLYYMAPNVKQRFLSAFPGALLAIGAWIGASYVLGIYMREFANYNKTYGAIGGVVALMLWFYVSATALLIGAEVNSELLKATGCILPTKEAPEPKNLNEEVRAA